jgi:uncharacterized membrane protein YeaQ/YmgE (transglycosylase-associated protein family)
MSLIVKMMTTLVIGGLVGWLASRVVKVDSSMDLLLGSGVLGSILGVGFAYSMDFGPYGPVGNGIVCVLGAVLAIAALQTLGYLGDRLASAC